jgi:serine/threonine protein kinase
MGQIYGERWEIVESLGEGGQAHTFLVVDKQGEGEPRYALKRLKNLERIQRFRAEIEAIRSLSHTNVLKLVDYDLEGDRPYLVTEYCLGKSLVEVEPFWHGSAAKTLELFGQICEGVNCAHHHTPPIIHRDLKPDNIYLRTPEGPAVVGDFGICYLSDDGTRITLTEEAVGPRLFIAPELEDGRIKEVSPKSDVYSLGKLLYWMFRGQVFSREKHRDPKWDLKGPKRWSGRGPIEEFWDNIYMEHVNRLLDRMIVVDPGERWNVDQILLVLGDVRRLIEKEFTPIARGIQQPCIYCGLGYYRQLDSKEVLNFGFDVVVGSPDWRILVCDLCGHVQIFRIDKAEQKDWWGSDD